MIIDFDAIDQSLKVGFAEWHRTGAQVFPHGPLLIAVPFAYDPLGCIPTRYAPAHRAITGRRVVSTNAGAAAAETETVSRCKMPPKYASALM